MNVNEAKSHYATSLLERVRADKIELARLGVDADSAIKMADEVDKLVAEVKQNMASAPAPLGAKRGRKAKQSPEDLREPMIAFVKKHPGCKAEQIREAIGAKPTQMPVLRVLTNHAVRTKGAKRATTYWPRGGK